jgi:hypothetical protein
MIQLSMRTTLNLDPDVLQAAKEIAANRGTTAGRVISDLVREALTPSLDGEVVNGIHMLPRSPKRSRLHTLEDVNRLRDEA